MLLVNQRIRNALWGVLPEVADEIDVPPPNADGIYKARIKVGRAVHVANVLWAGEGWPEDVNRVLSIASGSNRRQPTVICAARLSPGALERISRLGLGWVDESGSARIALPSGLAIFTEGRPAARPEVRLTWTPAAIAVAEVLLSASDTSVRSINALTGVSLGRISSILQALDLEGFTRKRTDISEGPIREVVDRHSLIRAWSPKAAGERHERWVLTKATRDPLDYFLSDVIPILGDSQPWALTGPAAAQQVAPFLTTIPAVHAYIEPVGFRKRLQSLKERAGMVPVEQGGRFEFWSASKATLALAHHLDTPSGLQLPIADLPRVYADLVAMGGRYEEAAGHLMEATDLAW